MSTTIGPAEAMVACLRRVRSTRPHARQSDHQLVTRAAQGDELAVAELYDRHARLAYSVAFGITRNSIFAQDAVQDAFLQLWLKPAKIDPKRTSIAAWIVLLARRRAIDLTRSEARAARPRYTSAAELESPAADEQALTSIEGQRARAALRRLTPEQLAVIDLAYFRGLSQSEIARTLAITIGTVKSRTHTALACLRATLADAA